MEGSDGRAVYSGSIDVPVATNACDLAYSLVRACCRQYMLFTPPQRELKCSSVYVEVQAVGGARTEVVTLGVF